MVATPEALTIAPRTDAGSGLSTPVAKALSHLNLAAEAIHREWAKPNAVAQDIREASSHLNGFTWPGQLLSSAMAEELNEWKLDTVSECNALATRFTALAEDAEPSDENKELLDTLITRTMTMLTHIDREITGIPTADPGRMP